MPNVHRKEEVFKNLLELAQTLDWTSAREADAETALLAKTLKTFFSAVGDPAAEARLARALDAVASPSHSDIDSMLKEILYGKK